MRNKQQNNEGFASISKGGVLYREGELPVLSKDQIDLARIVNQLPHDFPIVNWESMNTKQQLHAMKFSGLNEKEQWSLLNSSVPLIVLDQHNQVQNRIEIAALAARTRATPGKSTNSTSLQTTAQQRKLDMKQEEYETRFYEKYAGRTRIVNTPNDSMKTPNGNKPTVDSRDEMEQKKDKRWEKTESTYNPREAMDRKKDEMWGQVNGTPLTYPAKPSDTPLPQAGAAPFQTPNPYSDNDTIIFPEPQSLPLPPGTIPTIETYKWYDSYDKAAEAWAKENVNLSKDLERCAMIYRNVDKDGNERYAFTKSYYGMDEVPSLGIRPNVAIPFAWLRYFAPKVPDSDIVGFIHSHPKPPKGTQYLDPSDEDMSLGKYGIGFVTVVPYENGGIPDTHALKDFD